jgi:hypothetical protein
MMTLADLFPDDDYRFYLRFHRGSAAEFFRPTSAHKELTAQRRHWLQTSSQGCMALLPEGFPLLAETIELARAEQTLPPEGGTASTNVGFSRRLGGLFSDEAATHFKSPNRNCLELGLAWEPDFLLLKRDAQEQIRLVAGCVCFPSSWSLADKIGHPIETIHGVVPGLNESIGTQIHGFLTKLKPGVAWLRANWGLSRSAELNQHPSRNLPRLDDGVRIDEVWLRIEHQALTALPRTGGVLFGIRIAVHPLAEIQRDPLLTRRLCRALRTMPEAMAQYKNIAPARERLIALLDQ